MKKVRITIVYLLALLLLVVSSEGATGLDQKSEKVIKVFLSSMETEQISTTSQGSALADLDNDGKQEIILVWTLLDPTSWQNHLSVFSLTPKGYKKTFTLSLIGEAKLFSVQNGIIYIDQKVYAKDDPVCCPSIKKQIRYRWIGKRIVEIKE
jgi:hypothetical protein